MKTLILNFLILIKTKTLLSNRKLWAASILIILMLHLSTRYKIVCGIAPVNFDLDFDKTIFLNLESTLFTKFDCITHENVDGIWSGVNLLIFAITVRAKG